MEARRSPVLYVSSWLSFFLYCWWCFLSWTISGRAQGCLTLGSGDSLRAQVPDEALRIVAEECGRGADGIWWRATVRARYWAMDEVLVAEERNCYCLLVRGLLMR